MKTLRKYRISGRVTNSDSVEAIVKEEPRNDKEKEIEFEKQQENELEKKVKIGSNEEEGSSKENPDYLDIPIRNTHWSDYLIHDWRVRLVYVILLGGCLGLVVPTLVTILMPGLSPTSIPGSCLIDYRFRVALEGNGTADECYAAGGCWNASASLLSEFPRCYHTSPSRYSYKVIRIYEFQAPKQEISTEVEPQTYIDVKLAPAHIPETSYISNIATIRLTVYAKTKDQLVIRASRQLGKENIPDSYTKLPDSDFLVFANVAIDDYFRLRIFRRSTRSKLFDTTYGPFVLSDDYNEFTTFVPTEYIYGLPGSNSTSLLKKFDNRKQVLYNSPRQANQGTSYGYHPFYMGFDTKGDAYGVLVSSGAPMEVTYSYIPALTFKTVGNNMKIFIFAGPTPKNVTYQLTTLLSGYSNAMPPKWTVNGLNLCRETWNGTIFKDTITKLQTAKITVGSDCIDKFLFPTGNFSHDVVTYPSASVDVAWLTDKNVKFVATYPPHIAKEGSIYDLAFDANLLIRDPSAIYVLDGKYNNKAVCYPNYASPGALTWIKEVMNKTTLLFDGLFMVDNSPYNEVRSSCEYKLPFEPSGVDFGNYTICPDATYPENPPIKHLSRHNRYGFSHLYTAYYELSYEQNRVDLFLASESSYTGTDYQDFYGSESSTGFYGSAFLGDFSLDWSSLKVALVRLMEYGLSGNFAPIMPICGTLNSNNITDVRKLEELCTRWYQIGAVSPVPYSFSRESQRSTSPDTWTVTMMNHVRDLFKLRAGSMDFYTRLERAIGAREPIIRPLFYDFPTDNQTWRIDTQFMLGPDIMIAPNLLEQQTSVINVYFPKGKWVDFYRQDSTIFKNMTAGNWQSVQTNPYVLNMYVKTE